jgi:hypothetical protein
MTVTKVRRLVNPGRRRKMTAKQIRYFGTKRQRAALRMRHNPRRKRSLASFFGTKRVTKKSPARYKEAVGGKRRKNVGSILTVFPAGLNPGRKRKRYTRKRRANRGSKRVVIINKGVTMARTRKRRRTVHHNVVHRRKRRNYGTRVGRSWGSYARRGKRRNPGRRRHYVRHIARRRRNPGFASGTMGRVFGVIGGAAVTKLLSGFLPASFSTGILGYLGVAAIAFAQGKAVSKFARNPALGNDMMVGGFTYLAIKVLNDFVPSIGSMVGFSGMGLLAPSSFYVPQVNVNGSMGQFVLPAGIPVGAPASSAGVGRLRRQGRLM